MLFELDTWENAVSEIDPDNLYQPIRMQDQHADKESGLHDNCYHYYDPRQGRYITQDPIGLLGGVNCYQYPLNPLQIVDPLGLDIVIEGSGEFKKSTQEAMDTLKSQPEGKKLVEALENSSATHIIRETSGGNSAQEDKTFWQGVKSFFGFKSCDTIINFNPSRTSGGKDENGSRERPPFVGLGHEMGHANAMDQGIQVYDRGSGVAGTIPPSEIQSMEAENAIRKEHGLPSRPSY